MALKRKVSAALGLVVLAPLVVASAPALAADVLDGGSGASSATAEVGTGWAAAGVVALEFDNDGARTRPAPRSTTRPTAQGSDVPAGAPLVLADLSSILGSQQLAAPGGTGTLGVPQVAIDAYQAAAERLAADDPGCAIPWTLLAGVGRIESGHARGGRVDVDGLTLGRIIGPVLDGTANNAAISDTDGGRLDGDRVWDRAVGPMQFIPGTWAGFGADNSGDGEADPHNLRDATLGSGRYLCSGGLDLSDPAQVRTAVFRYNNSTAYVDAVISWAEAYATGVEPTESAPGPVPSEVVTPDPEPAPVPDPEPVPAPAPAPTPAPAPEPAPEPSVEPAPLLEPAPPPPSSSTAPPTTTSPTQTPPTSTPAPTG